MCDKIQTTKWWYIATKRMLVVPCWIIITYAVDGCVGCMEKYNSLVSSNMYVPAKQTIEISTVFAFIRKIMSFCVYHHERYGWFAIRSSRFFNEILCNFTIISMKCEGSFDISGTKNEPWTFLTMKVNHMMFVYWHLFFTLHSNECSYITHAVRYDFQLQAV